VLYENSLSLALLALFVLSFIGHAIGGAAEFSAEQAEHGGAAIGVVGYMATPHFWFESLQNWQSEFLAVGVLVLFSVYLRQRGSPESKPVDAPHSETGSE
jgi:ABC-type dipeptide/oligopeptide/nickel transport system permease component